MLGIYSNHVYLHGYCEHYQQLPYIDYLPYIYEKFHEKISKNLSQ